jgi:hypothetical protein
VRLVAWARWPQVDGGVRIALSSPSQASANARELRSDPALADQLGADVIVEYDADGTLRAWEWPGRRDGKRPPWRAIRDALVEVQS